MTSQEGTTRCLSRPARLAAVLVAVLVGSAGCAGTDSPSATRPDPTFSPPAVSPSPPTAGTTGNQSATRQPTTEGHTVTAIRITVDGQTRIAQLADNPTARDLVEQLPLRLTFRDLNGVEKNAKLPRPLTTDGAPAGADPEVNDIGYYAPAGDLVLYYGDVGYYNGIVRIGRFDDGDLDFIERQPDGFDVTIEAA